MRIIIHRTFQILIIALLLFGCAQSPDFDLVIEHASIYNVEEGKFERKNIAIKNEKIAAISNKVLTAKRHIDATGKFVYPGFIDAHAHFVGYSQSLLSANLLGTSSFKEVVQRVVQFAENNPDIEFITGRGWDQNDWPENSFPTNDTLNILFPNTPILLTRIDGHAALANDAALKTLRVLPDSVEGGKIVLADGKPTGLLIDNAVDLIVVPDLSESKLIEALKKAQANCFSVGLTHVVDAGLDRRTILLLDSLQNQGTLKMPIYAMIKDNPESYGPFLDSGPLKTERLSVRSIKVYGDGALGSRGALLLKPYADDPQNFGLMLKKSNDLEELANRAFQKGFQINVHAIGDSANRLVLQALSTVLPKNNDARWRIEHAQVVNPADSIYFQQFGILPSVQPTHATSDMYWAEERLGPERINHAYAFNSLLEWSGQIPLGTDFPVEDIDPRKTLYAAVTRQDAAGFPEGGFTPNERLSRADALRGMTIWAAFAQFQEDETGSIAEGKWADLIITDTDFITCEPLEILDAEISTTLVHGEIVHDVNGD